MSSDPVIEAYDLGKAYPIYRRPEDRLKQLLWGRRRRFYEEFWAVRGVDLAVGRGETLGIIGRNGSGKSTLLQMICGTLAPSSGAVRVRGRIAAMLELGSGFNPEFTGRENARMGAAVLGLARDEIDARFAAIAEFADIGAFMDQPIKRYSSGMHARLAFAVCANVDADVLIVDEVLSVGDAAFQQKCMRFLNRFRTRGTLLFVSHDSGAIVKLCDRALWLDQGQVRSLGPAKDVSRLYLAAQAEETADDAARFRIGGRTAVPPAAKQHQDDAKFRSNETTGFAFDPDGISDPQGGARIESAGFHDRGGARLRVAGGGEAVELKIACRAGRPLQGVIIAFVVRDRLGQILFSDDTDCGPSQLLPHCPEGSSFAVRFEFSLPYLASGTYAIESFLFERANDGCALLDRHEGCEFLHVQSSHISNGLANIAMRAVTLETITQSQTGTDCERRTHPPVAAAAAE